MKRQIKVLLYNGESIYFDYDQYYVYWNKSHVEIRARSNDAGAFIAPWPNVRYTLITGVTEDERDRYN